MKRDRWTYSLLEKTMGREAHLVPVDGRACSLRQIRAVQAMIEERTWWNLGSEKIGVT